MFSLVSALAGATSLVGSVTFVPVRWHKSPTKVNPYLFLLTSPPNFHGFHSIFLQVVRWFTPVVQNLSIKTFGGTKLPGIAWQLRTALSGWSARRPGSAMSRTDGTNHTWVTVPRWSLLTSNKWLVSNYLTLLTIARQIL